MISTIHGIVIFSPTGITHREARHRSFRSIIRHTLDQGEPRAAVRAIDEGIAVPSVARIQELSKTVIACCEIGGAEGSLSCVAGGFENPEATLALYSPIPHVGRTDFCVWRYVCREVSKKCVNTCCLSLDLDLQAV
jgi:hypothetical protein